MLEILHLQKAFIRLCIGLFLCLAMLALAACSGGDQGEEAACYAEVNEDKFFLGTVDCLEELPEIEICGYWAVGFEYSVLFEDLRALKNRDLSRGYWLNLSPHLAASDEYSSDDKTSVYRICFKGSQSTTKGYYADGFDDLAGGVLVKEFAELKLLAEDGDR